VIVDHPLYQRLRRISQTSLTSAVYPTATGTRFEHGLGAMHLAMSGFRSAWANASNEDVRTRFLDAVRADAPTRYADQLSTDLVRLVGLGVGGAALLHDVGHPPFSHVLEPLYEELALEHFKADPELLQRWRESARAYHEFVGATLNRDIVRDIRPDPLGYFILQILDADEKGATWSGALHSIVAGEVDVDRLDYVMRDAQKAGTEFGAIDYARLMSALELHDKEGRFRIAPGLRARSAVETLLLQRTQAYKWITYHPRVVGANLALAQAMDLFRKLTESQESFGPEENRHTAAEVFAPRWPELNYLLPSERELMRRLETESEGTLLDFGDQLQLDEQQLRGLVTDLRHDMQASVDDSTVIEALKAAGILAKALLVSGEPTQPLRKLLEEFLTFQQHALLRAKNCLPAWKTVDEFDSATEVMKEKMAKAVEASYDSVLSGPDVSGSDLEVILKEEQRELVDLIRKDPAIGVNRVITEIFDGEPRYLEQFGRHLGTIRNELEKTPGLWKVEYTGFTSVEEGDGATVLFDGPAERRLYESSALAQALARVEAARPRLLVFFFTLYPSRVPAGNDTDSKEMRQKLTGDVVDSALPEFVQMTLPTVVRERFDEASPSRGGSK